MMLLVEFGATDSDSSDEITYKKLKYIESQITFNNREIGKAISNPHSGSFDKDISFYNNTLTRYLTEKSETLRSISCKGFSTTMNSCCCIYCTKVLPERWKSMEITGFGNGGLA
jgi:hypothetical protein